MCRRCIKGHGTCCQGVSLNSESPQNALALNKRRKAVFLWSDESSGSRTDECLVDPMKRSLKSFKGPAHRRSHISVFKIWPFCLNGDEGERYSECFLLFDVPLTRASSV